MPIFTINASIRNKAGKSLLERKPLWRGDVPDARKALADGVTALVPVVAATAGADTIILHCLDSKGGLTTSTEYAEDIIGGAGKSANQSTLIGDNEQMSEDDRKAGIEAVKQAAIEALPQTIKDRLAERAQEKCKWDLDGGLQQKDCERRHTFAYPDETSDPIDNQAVRDMMKRVANKQDALRPATPEDMKRFGMEGADPTEYVIEKIFLGDQAIWWDYLKTRKGGTVKRLCSHNQRGTPGPKSWPTNSNELMNELRRLEANSRRAAHSINMTREAFDQISRNCSSGEFKEIWAGSFAGVPINIVPSNQGHPHVQISLVPRSGFASGGLVNKKYSELVFIDEAESVPKHVFDKMQKQIADIVDKNLRDKTPHVLGKGQLYVKREPGKDWVAVGEVPEITVNVDDKASEEMTKIRADWALMWPSQRELYDAHLRGIFPEDYIK